MKEGPRPALGFYFSPRTRVFHILVRVKGAQRGLGGLLGQLARRVSVIESVSYRLEDGSTVWSAFCEPLSKGDTQATLRRSVAANPFVLESSVRSSYRGLVVDSFHSGMEIAPGRPVMAVSVAGFSRICGRLSKLLGTGGSTVLFEEGSILGQSTGRLMNSKISRGRLDTRLAAALSLYRASGWGAMSLKVEDTQAQFRVRAHECLECSGTTGEGECSFLRGVLVGLVSTLSASEFKGEESKCRLRGDFYCEFLLQRQEALEGRRLESASHLQK